MKSKYIKQILLLVVVILISVAASYLIWGKDRNRDNEVNSDYNCSVDSLRDNASFLKTYEETLNLVKLYCGEPDSDIGSGIYIPRWNLSKTESLTLYQFRGLIYSKDDKSEYLIQTINYIIDNIYGDYSISYNDIANNQQIWLGTLRLNQNGNYEYYELSKFSDDVKEEIKDTFFVKNPNGNFTLSFENKNIKTTRLEELEDNEIILRVSFSDQNDSFDQFIRVDTGSRELYFHSTISEIEKLRINKGWTNSYYEPNISRSEYEITIPDYYFNYNSHGNNIDISPQASLLEDIQFFDPQGNFSFFLWEPTKISEPARNTVEDEKWMENKMKVFLPQAATNIRSNNISINGSRFTRLTYDVYSLPEMDEYIGTEYVYGIELNSYYVFFTHVSMSDVEFEELLTTFRILD
jgi:hypothetical protein